jgi:hypothetical protein
MFWFILAAAVIAAVYGLGIAAAMALFVVVVMILGR